VSDGHRERASLFLRAARWLRERGGDVAVIRAFGDPVPIDAAWELPLEDFKAFLRQRCRVALKSERGAA
jgi:hypothetical protein